MMLSNAQKESLAERAAQLEAKTGVEVVVSLVERCDHYPELPWKAFALASSVAALGVALGEWMRPDWIGVQHATLAVLIVLSTGAAAALLTLAAPPWARFLLDADTVEAESRQFAAALFLKHGWFKTVNRNCILMLVAKFERTVVVLPDIGLADSLSSVPLARVVHAMQPQLACGETAEAIRHGLEALEALIRELGLARPKLSDEVSELIVEEKP